MNDETPFFTSRTWEPPQEPPPTASTKGGSHKKPNGSNGAAEGNRHDERAFDPEYQPPGAQEDEPPTVADLNWFTAADLAGKPVPKRSWHVRDLVPGRQVTILSGDGGVGKTILALQLAAATEAGSEWIGQLPEQGHVVFASAEDDEEELHRRLSDVAASHGISLADLPGLHLTSLAGREAVMGEADKAGAIRETAVWRALVAKVEQIKPRLVILDPLADVFGGDEIKRAQARQFIALLRGLAIKYDCAVLLLNHPSLSGMASGSGTSGSTAWSNSVRSRLYFERIKDADDVEIDTDLRVLKVMKANYGPVGVEVRVRWSKGVFRLDGQTAGGFDKLAADAKADRTFLDCSPNSNGRSATCRQNSATPMRRPCSPSTRTAAASPRRLSKPRWNARSRPSASPSSTAGPLQGLRQGSYSYPRKVNYDRLQTALRLGFGRPSGGLQTP